MLRRFRRRTQTTARELVLNKSNDWTATYRSFDRCEPSLALLIDITSRTQTDRASEAPAGPRPGCTCRHPPRHVLPRGANPRHHSPPPGRNARRSGFVNSSRTPSAEGACRDLPALRSADFTANSTSSFRVAPLPCAARCAAFKTPSISVRTVFMTATRLRNGIQPMALSFPNQSRSYDLTRRAVRFWGYDSVVN